MKQFTVEYIYSKQLMSITSHKFGYLSVYCAHKEAN